MGAIDSGRWLRASGHLDRVLELPPEEWEGYIVTVRLEDPEIAGDVQAMLDQHRQLSAEGFLDSPPPAIKPTEVPLAGVAIGAYTLVSPIGHGGMGSVWLASRSDGRFEGQAAVKLLNAALVGRSGEERFKREGTFLARLAHPHIARLIDAGVSNTGQPYLVLELVDGHHIDAYCDENRLSVEARIRLFLDVQSAVAHAHANLIVHRDLKPSNVLVTRDGQVKLLDFSIAKLIEDHLETGALPLTREAGSALTPKYAAPEQVTGGAITTATDVYALGVLLFELLSGQHPAGTTPRTPAEFVKAVVDQEPLKLSATVPQAGTSAIALALKRESTPERLKRQLAGDLETIIGKALKKEPAERYGSVAEFADDLRRYVEHQPISARPDSLGYRAAKFSRRHRPILAAAAIAVVVLAGLVGFYTVRMAAERDRAHLEAQKASQISALLTQILTSTDPYRNPDGKEPTIQNLLDSAAERITKELGNQPLVQAEMLTLIGRTFERQGLFGKALPLEERALAISRSAQGAENVQFAFALNNLGVLRREVGDSAAAEPLLVESLAIRKRLLGAGHQDVAITLIELSRVLRDLGRNAEAEAPVRESLAIRKAVFGDDHRETSVSKNALAQVLWESGDLDGAEGLYREAIATNLKVLGPEHPNTGATKANLGMLLNAKGDSAPAEALFRESLEVDRRVFGANHPDYANTPNNLAIVVETQGRLEEAQGMFSEALRIAGPQLTAEHPRVATMTLNLARVQIKRGRGAGTEPALRRVLNVRRSLYRPRDWRVAQVESLLGASLLAQGRLADAEPLMLAADKVLKPLPGVQARERLANRARLVSLYERLKRPADANNHR